MNFALRFIDSYHYFAITYVETFFFLIICEIEHIKNKYPALPYYLQINWYSNKLKMVGKLSQCCSVA